MTTWTDEELRHVEVRALDEHYTPRQPTGN